MCYLTQMNKNICQTCLSEDRQTTPIIKMQHLLQEINIPEITNINGNMCWECKKILMKFTNFKLQARQAQEILKFKNKNKQCFSRLTIENKVYYDYFLYHDLDPLNDDKNKIDTLKEEDTINDTDNNAESDFDDKPQTTQDACNDYVEFKNSNDKKNHDDSIIDDNLKAGNELFSGNVKIDDIKNERSENFKIKSKRKKIFKTSKVNDDDVQDKFSIKVFTVEEMLKNREEKRNQPNFKKIPFKCDSCVLGFTREENRVKHLKMKHSKKVGRYICDVCRVRFPSKTPLERHCRKHFTCYKCRLCKYETVEMWSAYNHCRTKHSADKLNKIHCQQCTLVFRTPEDLTEHISTEHMLYCNECGEKFKGKNTLRTHKSRIHGVRREFICEICNKTFKTKSRLESHTSTHSASIAQKLAYCTICRVQYKNIHVYRNHLRNSAAHSHDAYACPECNKKFASKVYWTKHYNFYHLKKSQFKCEICNKLFISDWRLKNHRQKHHGLSRSRDHPCDVCGKKFFTLSTLRAHQLTHSEHRSYMCEDCGDTFKQRPALYTHSKLVHKGVKRKK